MNKHLKIISKIVSESYNIPEKEMFMKTRRRKIADVRAIFFYFASRHTRLTLEKIGQFSQYMGRDKPQHHATVLYSCNKVKDIMSINKTFNEKINYLNNQIQYHSDYERQIADESQVFKQNISKYIYSDFDAEFLKKVSDVIEHIYSNKKIINLMVGFTKMDNTLTPIKTD